MLHTNSGLCVQSEKDVFSKRAMLILQHCGLEGKEKKYQVLLHFTFLFSLLVFVSAAGHYFHIWTGHYFSIWTGQVPALLF